MVIKELMEPDRLAVLFDWIGSILMLGTVWGWVYSRISPSIKLKVSKSKRRLKAIQRLITKRFGEGFSDPDRHPVFRRYWQFRLKVGIKPDMHAFRRTIVLKNYSRDLFGRYRNGRASKEEMETYLRFRKDREEAVILIFLHVIAAARYKFRNNTFRIIDKVTLSIFSGKIGFVLFIFGFLLWNLSKALSLYVLRN